MWSFNYDLKSISGSGKNVVFAKRRLIPNRSQVSLSNSTCRKTKFCSLRKNFKLMQHSFSILMQKHRLESPVFSFENWTVSEAKIMYCMKVNFIPEGVQLKCNNFSLSFSTRNCFHLLLCTHTHLNTQFYKIARKEAITKLKKGVERTIDKFRFNNSLAINGTILRFAYQKIDVQRSTFSNF